MRLILILIFFPLCCISQQLKSLTVGDKLPAQLLISLAENKELATGDPYFILDFWATWCTSCLRHFPLQDSLQKQFDGRLKFLLVNERSSRDDEKKIKAFFEKHRLPGGTKFSLPYIIEDTILGALFPHKLLPHYVWINTAGKVVAITGAEEISFQNVSLFVNDKPLDLSLKKDLANYDVSIPLLINGNAGDPSALLYRSTITKYLDGLNSSTKGYTDDHSQKRTLINQPILGLYRSVFRFSPNAIVLEVKDSSRYLYQGMQPKTNLFSYEISAPLSCSAEKLNKLIAADLDRCFDLHGRMVERLMDCWQLIRLPSADSLLKTKGEKPSLSMYSAISPQTVFINHPVSKLIDMLNRQTIAELPIQPIVIDETNFQGPVDLTLDCPLDDLVTLKKELNKYGLDLIHSKKKLPVFVLSENNP